MAAPPSNQKVKFGRFAVGTTDVHQPGPGQLLIKVEAAVLNPIDWKVQAYNTLDLVEVYPSVQGWDLSGTVVAVGEGVSTFVVGDRVINQARYDHTQWAMYDAFTQCVVADAGLVVKIPDTMAFQEAATLPSALSVAALPLYNQSEDASSARLTPAWLEDGQQRYSGKPIFIAGGATSVGQYVIQLACLSGFSPIITTASLRNDKLLRSLGATHVLDRTLPSDELQAEATRIADGSFELVYDAEVQEAAATDGDMKRVHVVFGVMGVPCNVDAATSLLGKLPEVLELGKIKPSRVEVIPGGLNGIASGLERLKNDQVHAIKLVVRPHDTR